MSNPLMRKRKLDPIPGPSGTTNDIESRLKGAMHPGEAILSKGLQPEYKPITTNTTNMYKTSAALHLNIAPDDNLSIETRETKTPYESLIFDPLTRDPLEHFTLIESKSKIGLKSGKFLKMMKQNLTFEDTEEEYTPVPQIEKEKSVYLQLQVWAIRLHKIFLLLQGFLAGVALLHIYLIFFNQSGEKFIGTYGQLARIIAMMFHILIFFALVGAILRAFNERKHYHYKEATEYGYDTEKHRLPFYIAVFCSVCYFIAYGLTTFTARFDNRMHFEFKQSNIWLTDGTSYDTDLTSWRILCIIRDILVILAWIVFCTQSNWNIGSSFLVKIEELTSDRQMTVVQDQEVYHHLFYGNPYLPYGVYQVNIKAQKTDERKKKST